MTTTSGLTVFTMDVDDILNDALLPLGGEYTSGAETQRARRSLNLLLIKLQNKNIPLNRLDTVSVPLVTDTSRYVLEQGIQDVLEVTYKDGVSGNEIGIEPKGLREFHLIPNKAMSAMRPTTFTIERTSDNFTMRVWPVPDATLPVDSTMEILVAKKIEDVTASYQKVSLSVRYYPLVVNWLSYELSLSRPNIAPDIREELKKRVIDAAPDAFDSDGERADLIIRPGGVSGR